MHGEPAGARAVAVGTGAYAFAAPPFLVTRWPSGAEFMTDRLSNVRAFPGEFLDDGPVLSSMRQVRPQCGCYVYSVYYTHSTHAVV